MTAQESRGSSSRRWTLPSHLNTLPESRTPASKTVPAYTAHFALGTTTTVNTHKCYLSESKRLSMAYRSLITRLLVTFAGFFLFASSPDLFWARTGERWPTETEDCHHQHLRACVVLNFLTCAFGLAAIVTVDFDQFKLLKRIRSSYCLACTWVLSLITTAVFLDKTFHCEEAFYSWQFIFQIMSFVLYCLSISWPIAVWLKEEESEEPFE